MSNVVEGIDGLNTKPVESVLLSHSDSTGFRTLFTRRLRRFRSTGDSRSLWGPWCRRSSRSTGGSGSGRRRVGQGRAALIAYGFIWVVDLTAFWAFLRQRNLGWSEAHDLKPLSNKRPMALCGTVAPSYDFHGTFHNAGTLLEHHPRISPHDWANREGLSHRVLQTCVVVLLLHQEAGGSLTMAFLTCRRRFGFSSLSGFDNVSGLDSERPERVIEDKFFFQRSRGNRPAERSI